MPKHDSPIIITLFGDPVGIQTQDLQNRNLTLYSAKLRDQAAILYRQRFCKRAETELVLRFPSASESYAKLRKNYVISKHLKENTVFLSIWQTDIGFSFSPLLFYCIITAPICFMPSMRIFIGFSSRTWRRYSVSSTASSWSRMSLRKKSLPCSIVK